MSGEPGKVKAKSGILKHLEKVWEEATGEGKVVAALTQAGQTLELSRIVDLQ